MIWMVITKVEMQDGVSHNFKFNREALGKDNIKLAVVDETDKLDFVNSGDVIISRTTNHILLQTIKQKGVPTTAEDRMVYESVKDKVGIAIKMKSKGIKVPTQCSVNEVEYGKTYFVKPRFGNDSFGISERSICKSKLQVKSQVEYLRANNFEPIIEEFIDGVDCTVALWKDDVVHTCAIEVECPETNGIQTRDCKTGFKEHCVALNDKNVRDIAKDIFTILGIKHHARIDFRRDNMGFYYVIDVNLLPGLGPIDHFAKCLLLSANISYIDAMKVIVNSAT